MQTGQQPNMTFATNAMILEALGRARPALICYGPLPALVCQTIYAPIAQPFSPQDAFASEEDAIASYWRRLVARDESLRCVDDGEDAGLPFQAAL